MFLTIEIVGVLANVNLWWMSEGCLLQHRIGLEVESQLHPRSIMIFLLVLFGQS
jgi:hypothetical protein